MPQSPIDFDSDRYGFRDVYKWKFPKMGGTTIAEWFIINGHSHQMEDLGATPMTKAKALELVPPRISDMSQGNLSVAPPCWRILISKHRGHDLGHLIFSGHFGWPSPKIFPTFFSVSQTYLQVQGNLKLMCQFLPSKESGVIDVAGWVERNIYRKPWFSLSNMRFFHVFSMFFL